MSKTCFCGISEHCWYQIETDMEQHDKVIYEEGYNKAIDEFAEKLTRTFKCEELQTDFIAVSDVINIIYQRADQLKGGAE